MKPQASAFPGRGETHRPLGKAMGAGMHGRMEGPAPPCSLTPGGCTASASAYHCLPSLLLPLQLPEPPFTVLQHEWGMWHHLSCLQPCLWAVGTPRGVDCGQERVLVPCPIVRQGWGMHFPLPWEPQGPHGLGVWTQFRASPSGRCRTKYSPLEPSEGQVWGYKDNPPSGPLMASPS